MSPQPPASSLKGAVPCGNPSHLPHQVPGSARPPCPEDVGLGPCEPKCPDGSPAPSPPRKKLSNFLHTQQWKGASNYVAKRYIELVDRDVYFEDVRLQMEAKLWGEEYNRHKPPKQVCGALCASCPHQGSWRQGRETSHRFLSSLSGC